MKTLEHNGRVRVLIVDDSALARKLLRTGLEKDPGLEIVGAAATPELALDMMAAYKPDVVTLDVEMPGMDGVTLLKKFMSEHPIPTVMVSSLTEHGKKVTLDALEAGAVDVVAKPRVGVVDGLPAMMGDLTERVKAAARVDVSRFARRTPPRSSPTAELQAVVPTIPSVPSAPAHLETTDRVIAIGASAGGVAALTRVIPGFPPAAPGIVVVQHMPAGFTTSFAERLNSLSSMQVKEAEDGDRVRAGLVLLAPGGDRHMRVVRSGGEYRVTLRPGDKVSGHRPSVDVLFESVAAQVGRQAAAAILTGMGSDGAEGLLKIREAGGRTFAQDEQTSVVFGMPNVAWEIHAAEEQLPLDLVARRLLAAAT